MYVLCIGILLSWHANDVMFWGTKPILGRKRITLPEPYIHMCLHMVELTTLLIVNLTKLQ